MEGVALDRERVHLLVGDLSAGRVEAFVQFGADGQSALGGGGADQVHHHLVADQRLAAPVLGDVAEHAMLDLVPFAGAGREVAHRDAQPQRVRKLLQLELPQPAAAAVGAAAVGGDQQAPRVGVGAAPHLPPPAAQRRHGELRRVVVHADAHPARVGGQVVDPVGDRLAEFAVDEVVHLHLVGAALRTPFPPAVAIPADQLLLLGVHRHHRLPEALELRTRRSMRRNCAKSGPDAGAPQRLAVGLQAVAQRSSRFTVRSRACPAAPSRRAPRCAAAGPAQRPLRVAERHRVELPLQRGNQPGVNAR